MTRESLIREGRRLFAERGIHAARIEDLTRSAGIAKGTLYTYFADKDELIRAIVESGLAELREAMERSAGRATGLETVAGRILAAHVDVFGANPELVSVLHQLRGNLVLERARWRPLWGLLADHLGVLVAALGRSPRFAALPAATQRAIALMAYGAVSGVTSVSAALGRREPGRAAARDLSECIARMVATRVEMAEAHARRGLA